MQKVTNKEVRNRLKVREDLVQVVMRRKLSLFGQIFRMDNFRMILAVMTGTMEGTGKRGRPHREWLDDITEWCQKDLHHLCEATRDRVRWKLLMQCAVDTYGLSAHGL